MELKDILCEYGLTNKESDVYMALLELGPAPARSIARRAGVNRGTAYDVVKKLVDQGLATYYRKGKQHFAAEPPERLIDAIEDKQSKLQRLKTGITDKLPELKALFQQNGGRPSIRVYEGSKGIKKLLSDVLSTLSNSETKEYYVYSSATAKERQSIYKDFPEFNQKRIAQGIKVQTIALGEGGETAGLDERKQIGTGSKKSSATHEIIYEGKVAQIGLDASGTPVGVIIENAGIYQTQRLIFAVLWKKLKS